MLSMFAIVWDIGDTAAIIAPYTTRLLINSTGVHKHALKDPILFQDP